MTKPSEQTPSGEFDARLGRKVKPWVWAITIGVPVILLIVHLARLPTPGDVSKQMEKGFVSKVQFADVPTRQSVYKMIKRMCVSREEHAETKGKIRANTKLLKRIDKNVGLLLRRRWKP